MVQIQRLIVSLSQGCRGQIKRNHTEKRTCERIAVEHGVGSATVRRAEKYSRGIDAAEEAVPGAQEDMLFCSDQRRSDSEPEQYCADPG